MLGAADAECFCMRLLQRRFAVRRAIQGHAGASFGLRLGLSFAATLIVVGAVGYVFMDSQLKDSQIEQYAKSQRDDARTFELYGATAKSHAAAIAQIDQVLDARGRQEGALETLLIDPNGIVRASGDADLEGTRHGEERVLATLKQGKSYAGYEVAEEGDTADFEVMTPVNLPDGRYALELSFEKEVLNAQLAGVRRGLLLVGLLVLLLGGGVFYLFGGRSLLRAHRAALHRATRDGLTDLPNQRAFQDELPQAIAAAERSREPLALIALDVDDFKFINDRHGHPHGDAILRRVAEVLRQGRPGDRAYRIGGDEFALLLPHTNADGARVLAKRLLRDLDQAKLQVTAGASASGPEHRGDLRAEADAALYEAKRLGGNQAAHYDDVREHVAVVGPEKLSAVRRLLEEKRITTVYQPIWDISNARLIGIEALSRPAEDYGFSGPSEAFDIAEQMGRVHDLDVVCVESALRRAAELPPGALLFLNLCPRTLDQDAVGDNWLRDAVEAAGLPTGRVVIELTERFGGRAAAIVKSLQRLRSQGFQVAVDDVGTGNSGLATLRQVPVEFVKLDRTIVASASVDPAARAVLMAMSTYARQTGAFVIAEGIEDRETLEFLQEIDQDVFRGDTIIQGGQGYGLGRPSEEMRVSPPSDLQQLHEAA
jgi:diguanylate cyclase (GGDEF)-like protein